MNLKSLMKFNKKYLVFMLIAFLFISISSKSTSIFYPNNYIIDSAIFQVIGTGITRGCVPYVDLYDHKGPILFFIQALGVLINKGFGIYILQIINCFITLIFIEKIICLFQKNNAKKWIVFAITLIFYSLFFSEGNLSEEWSLSFILIAFYLNMKNILNNTFSKTNTFITGFMFAIIALIRINNAASIIGYCVFYFFYLIYNKKCKEVFNFVGYFILGVLPVFIPIIILFIKWNALYEMIYATFLFNFIYGTSSELTLISIILKVFAILPLIYLFGLIYISKNEIKIKIYFGTLVLFNIIAVSVGFTYIHYYVILIPLFAVLFSYIITMETDLYKIVIMACIFIMYSLFIIYNLFTAHMNFNKSKLNCEDALELKSYITDTSSVLAYNVPAKIYMYLDVVPAYKYFVFQYWHSMSNPEIMQEVCNKFDSKEIKYIISIYYLPELSDNYTPIFSNSSYILYQVNQ